MLFLSILLALSFSSRINAIPSVSFFYPKTFDELTCANGSSWTYWFNSAHPKNKEDFDLEALSVIQKISGRDVCAMPKGVHARSVSPLTADLQYSVSWRTNQGLFSALVSRTPGVDFQVRLCCENKDFLPTTTTTPRPIVGLTCGRPKIKPTLKFSRIFGGTRAVPHSWPWQILYEEEKICQTNRTCIETCGGTLLDATHVLTAAHCIGGKNLSKIIVTAGVHNKRNEEKETRQRRQIDEIFRHPDWNSQTLANDLAILRLNQPMILNDYVSTVCLPGPDPQANADVVLIGWGAEQLGGNPNDELKQAQVKIIGQCYKYWNQFDDDNQICAAQPISGDSACQGDSGGPLLQNYNGQWVIQGVASFIDECKTNGNLPPNVYVKVSAYLSWIEKILRS